MHKKRYVARLILMNAQKRFLLLNGFGRVPERARAVNYWITPGGGLEEGEDYEQALRREAWEEISLELNEIGPWVWTDEFVIHFEEITIEFHSRYNFISVANHNVTFSNLNDDERKSVQGYRWWSLEELSVTDALFQPLNLYSLLQPLANGHLPEKPIHIVRL